MTRKIRFALALAITLASIIFVGAGRFVRLAETVSPSGNGNALASVAFTACEANPEEETISKMVDEVVSQSLGNKGWAALVKKGDHVVIKVNMVGPHRGRKGEKGKAIITDYRVVKAIAAGIRQAIGEGGSTDIIVTDALFYEGTNPSDPREATSFYGTGYDADGDGMLDGDSKARLVNADSYGKDRRFLTVVNEPILGKTSIWHPDFMRRPENPSPSGEYSDVVIYVPTFKSHGFVGITGAIKLSYGLRSNNTSVPDNCRWNHSGYGWGTGNKTLLLDYLCAQSRARKCDFVVLDALTGNRKGPLNGALLGYSSPTDWIETDVILASRDPVAIDTIETLFAGYDPDSVHLLDAAARDGLGESRVSRILISGCERFGKHRADIARRYEPKKTGKRFSGTWPFENGWGGATVRTDTTAPTFAEVLATRLPDGRFHIAYAVQDEGTDRTAIARTDLMIEGTLIESRFDEPEKGAFEFAPRSMAADASASAKGSINPRTVELVAWDSALNATRVSVPLQDDATASIGFAP